MGEAMVPPPGFEPGVAAPWGPPLFRRAPEASIKHYRFFLRISSAESGQRNATYGQSPVVMGDAMVPRRAGIALAIRFCDLARLTHTP